MAADTATQQRKVGGEPPAAGLDGRGPLLLGALLAGLLLARLVALVFNQTNLFFDEAQYWSWSLEPAFGYYSKPPLIAWIIRAATAVCGHGEACVRAASPVLHTATAAFVYLAGQRLYGAATGFWAALAFATLPGVSFSSGIISTDVPLLLCWAAALYAFVVLMEGEGWAPAIGLGVAIGLGLNAKYAMAYFPACAGLYLALTPRRRRLLRDPRLWAALAIAALLIAPNVAWNAGNAFATFGHTADNANWGRSLIHPLKMLEFVVSQFGVFGPVFFAVLLGLAWRARTTKLAEPDRLLLWLSLPVLAVITVQALLSRAHANWAAVAYVPATILVAATLLRDGRGWSWLRGSFIGHAAIAVVLAVGLAFAGRFELPLKTDPAARMLGWRELGQEVRRELAEARASQRPFRAVLTDERLLTATLLYYLRGEETPMLAWQAGAKPRDHYEMTRPYRADMTDPVLLVSLDPRGGGIPERFGTVGKLPPITVPTGAGQGATRTAYMFSLAGYKGR